MPSAHHHRAAQLSIATRSLLAGGAVPIFVLDSMAALIDEPARPVGRLKPKRVSRYVAGTANTAARRSASRRRAGRKARCNRINAA